MILIAVTRRLFWFLLVHNKDGQPYMGNTVSSVSLEPINVILEFRKAVKAMNSDDLSSFDDSDLDVYKNKSSFEKRNAMRGKGVPLKASLLLGDLGSKGEDPLYVAVPEVIPRWFQGIVQSAPPCKLSFYNKISEAEEKDCWIHFQTNIPMLDLITNRLYVRKSYETIADAILKGDRKRSIVTGTPGIGKSTFLIYLLWRLVWEKKRVFFLYDLDYIYYDGHGKILNLESVSLNREPDFWTMDLWCLFDAKGKQEQDLLRIRCVLCKTIVSTHPRRDLLNEFQKKPSKKWFYMPIWSEEEMRTISCMYPDAVDWQERFTYLGGIPRLVLEKARVDPSSIINQACKECSLRDCLNEFGPLDSIAEKTQRIHCLLHINSSNPYTKPSVVFASREALNMIVNEYEDDFNADAKRLLQACEENPLAAAFCGQVYECYAIDALGKGGNFTYRRWAHGNEKATIKDETLIIPPSKKRFFDKVLDNQKGNQLYIPKSKAYKGIDAWMPSIGGFQTTIATSHPIKDAIPMDVKLPDKKLYWVLPVEKYATFDHKALPNIEQFALLFPYPSFFTQESIG